MPKSRYTKPFLSVDEQLDLIESRGLGIRDRATARSHLKHFGYYRLSGYWYPFRQRSPEHREGIDLPRDVFRPGIWFEDIVAICEFDRKLRNIILSATEPFEMVVRAAVSYQIGARDPFLYLDRDYWGAAADKISGTHDNSTDFERFVQHQEQLISNSREAFVRHFVSHYDGPMSIWTAIELWDFGMLTRFFEVMHESDRESIATTFGLTGGRRSQGWLRAINDLRNVCAHHGRLFKRHFPNKPGIPKDIPLLRHIVGFDDQSSHRLYPLLCILAFTSIQSSNGDIWKRELSEQFQQLDMIAIASPRDFGFPDDWRSLALWRV